MARKEEITPIHPRRLCTTLNEYLGDVYFMQTTMDNAHRFLTDTAIDQAKAVPIVAEQIGVALDRMQKWRDASCPLPPATSPSPSARGVGDAEGFSFTADERDPGCIAFRAPSSNARTPTISRIIWRGRSDWRRG